MLRQNTSKTFMQISLAFVLSLCSLSAFSEGTRYITFLKKDGSDGDTYRIKALGQPSQTCISSVSPSSLKTDPGGEGKTIQINYLKTVRGCALSASLQYFQVRGKERPDRFGYIMWEKKVGKSPHVFNNNGMDLLGLTTIDDSDPNNIKVLVGYKDKSQ